jgi:uncharacterized protein YoxC
MLEIIKTLKKMSEKIDDIAEVMDTLLDIEVKKTEVDKRGF